MGAPERKASLSTNEDEPSPSIDVEVVPLKPKAVEEGQSGNVKPEGVDEHAGIEGGDSGRHSSPGAARKTAPLDNNLLREASKTDTESKTCS